MTRVTLAEDTRGVEVWAEGHAGFAAAGQDIVCAGVSALLFGALAYLRDCASGRACGGSARVDFAQGAGYLWFRTRHFRGGRDRVALALLATGLRQIAGVYPDHVSVSLSDTKDKEKKGYGRKSYGHDPGRGDRGGPHGAGRAGRRGRAGRTGRAGHRPG